MVRRFPIGFGFDVGKSLPLIILTIFCLSLFPSAALAQGTTLSIEDAELTEGGSVTLYLTLEEAIDGLGRLDATIVNRNPEVVQLSSISPEAVSDQFLQIDSESGEEIKFKLVDLGNNVDPGDEDVQLVSFGVEGVKEGEAELGLEGVSYTDEDGNVIEPNVTPSIVTVLSSEPESEGTESAQGEETREEEEPVEEPEREEGEKQKKEKGEVEKEVTPSEKESYLLEAEGIELRLAEKGKLTLSLSSLPEGFRLAETTIISDGGVAIDEVTGQEPLYYEVVERSEESINFRVGDFDGEVGPGTSELKMAEVQLEAIRVGWGSLRIRTSIQTDEGEEVVRTAEVTDIDVAMKSLWGSDSPPQDLDGDGLYEDVNGDGELTEKDAFALAFNLKGGSDGISAPLLDIFDFNRDGIVHFDDSVALIRMVKARE